MKKRLDFWIPTITTTLVVIGLQIFNVQHPSWYFGAILGGILSIITNFFSGWIFEKYLRVPVTNIVDKLVKE